jgi:hypothetical protein
MPRPNPSEHAPYYASYVNLVKEDDVVAAMESQRREFADFLSNVPESAGPLIHPPYTWSVNHVLDHVIDAERVFSYRALRIARGDTTSLPSFDENAFAHEARSDRCRVSDLAADFDLVRRSTIVMFRRFPEEAWSRSGIAAGHAASARALAYIIVGHAQHHFGILRKRLSR